MENEQVEIQEVEVSPEIQELEKQVLENGEQIEKAQKLTEEILAERKEFLESLEKDLFEKEKNLTLKDNGLEAFAEIINVDNSDDLGKVVSKLNKIVNDIKVANSYQPKDNATQDAYSVHANNKDTKSMIGSKLANLFK
ncbi:hypothetical protein PGC35_15735 [Psychrobacillus sp. PGGUH221]|uniref:hypothetical protein n=1 Tax=Psychrobacillus sp. PGGUH221 TaxID=3020058 RepID=UPI0035C6668B